MKDCIPTSPVSFLLLSSGREYIGAFKNKRSRYKLESSNVWTLSTFQGNKAEGHKLSNM